LTEIPQATKKSIVFLINLSKVIAISEQLLEALISVQSNFSILI